LGHFVGKKNKTNEKSLRGKRENKTCVWLDEWGVGMVAGLMDSMKGREGGFITTKEGTKK